MANNVPKIIYIFNIDTCFLTSFTGLLSLLLDPVYSVQSFDLS